MCTQKRIRVNWSRTVRDHTPEFDGWKKDSVLVISLFKDSIAFEPARYPTWGEENLPSSSERAVSERTEPSMAIEYIMIFAKEARRIISPILVEHWAGSRMRLIVFLILLDERLSPTLANMASACASLELPLYTETFSINSKLHANHTYSIRSYWYVWETWVDIDCC
jgi:hypothetical protein